MPIEWSASRVNLFLSCPHAYFLKYIRKAEEKRPSAMALGISFHEMIRRLHTVPNGAGRRFFFKSIESCLGAWWGVRFWGKWKETFEEKEWRGLGALGAEALKVYWEKETMATAPPLYVEKRFGGAGLVFEGYHLTGVFDQIRRMKDGLAIVDLKLSRTDPGGTAWKIWLNQNLQLTMYWWAAKQIWSTENISLYVHHFHIQWVKGNGDGYVAKAESRYHPTTRSEGDLDSLKAALDIVSQSVFEGNFPPTDDRTTCRYCLFTNICEKRLSERPNSGSEPKEMLEDVTLPMITPTPSFVAAKPIQERFRLR